MTDIIKKEPKFEKVDRFQSLQAGQYWRAQHTIVEEGIDEGEVLLIQSIRWVDNTPHTIILRPHPSKIGKRVHLDILQDDGSTRRSYFVYNEHRFSTSKMKSFDLVGFTTHTRTGAKPFVEMDRPLSQ